jgi:hypothetical protein
VKKLAFSIYKSYTEAGIEQLDLLVIMNSAFRFFSDLIDALNKLSEGFGQKRLKIVPHFVKITT